MHHRHCAQALIAAGARADLKNVDGKTPRDIAEDLGPKKRAKMLAALDAIDDKS